jgi:hypothetical protein
MKSPRINTSNVFRPGPAKQATVDTSGPGDASQGVRYEPVGVPPRPAPVPDGIAPDRSTDDGKRIPGAAGGIQPDQSSGPAAPAQVVPADG